MPVQKLTILFSVCVSLYVVLVSAACVPMPIPTTMASTLVTPPKPVVTPQSVIVAVQNTPTPTTRPATVTATVAVTVTATAMTTPTPTARPATVTATVAVTATATATMTTTVTVAATATGSATVGYDRPSLTPTAAPSGVQQLVTPSATADYGRSTFTPSATTDRARPTFTPSATADRAQPTFTPSATTDRARPTVTSSSTTVPVQPTITRTPSFTPTPTLAPTPTPAPVSFLQQRITNLYDLSRLPALEHTTVNQFTSRNWVAPEHYFDYFVDDGNFIGPHYGYLDQNGSLMHYRIVPGYDRTPEYEIVPRTLGPGTIDRIWFAYQQHESINNIVDMSKDEEWTNWGNLGAMGNIRFYFDDESVPRIDFTVKNLFVGRNPFPAPLSAFYASADGGNITYVSIPFQHSIRVTTTGRPRLMQVEVKQFATADSIPTTTPTVASTPAGQSTPVVPPQDSQVTIPDRSFALGVSSGEQTALDQAVQAWQSCTPVQPQGYQSFSLSIPHNDSAEVDFNTPATIAGLSVRIPRGMDDSVWMQVFWDGDNEPGMIAPLRAMFGPAERLIPYRSLPLGTISSESELTFYINFPMPFQSARIVFVNSRAETLPLTLQVALRETTPGTERSRLHAFYGARRVERREDDKDNYIAADIQGRGKYVGLILSAWDLDRRALNGPLPDSWRFPYLESNMDIWVDGRLALPGTGIEDDFNASYYYVYAGYQGYKATYCLAGVTLLDYSTVKEPSSQYRFYLNDAPEFRDRLRVEIQHGNKGNNLSVTYSSTAFWYVEK